MPWQHIRISRFGGPEVLQMAEEPAMPEPGAGEVRIKVLAAGTSFTDTMIRRGRYPDFKGPLPFTPGYELVGIVEKVGAGVVSPREGELVADLCVVGGYAQYRHRSVGHGWDGLARPRSPSWVESDWHQFRVQPAGD
jgi:NADPH:quinone reductase-like Zn-dependent oxidoreductase